MRPPRPLKLQEEKSSELGEGALPERGARSPSGRRGFLSATCPDLVMSFNSLLATGFLPVLLGGEGPLGPLGPMPATHQFTQSPSSGMCTHTHTRTRTHTRTHTRMHACMHTHKHLRVHTPMHAHALTFPGSWHHNSFPASQAPCGGHSQASSEKAPQCLSLPHSPAAAYPRGQSLRARPPFLQENF